MIHEPLLRTNETTIVKSNNEFSPTPGLEWCEGVYNPVVGVDSIRTLMYNNAMQGQQCLWIGERWGVPVLFINEKWSHTLQRAADSIDAHSAFAFEFW